MMSVKAELAYFCQLNKRSSDGLFTRQQTTNRLRQANDQVLFNLFSIHIIAMPSHALDQRLFERTNSLTDENDSILASPQDGVDLIDNWLRVIAGDNSTQLIEEQLKELRNELTLEEPDDDRVRGLLRDLGDNTALIAQSRNVQEPTAKKLDDLAFTLRSLAGM